MREIDVVTLDNKEIQNKMKRCVDQMMAEHNRIEDEATINALRSYGYEVIKWHPYPKEKPTPYQPIQSDFLVTYHTEQYGSHVCVDTWHEGHFDRYDKYVVAWAELPKPYEEKA